jgi:hypothetical protein
MRNTDSTQSLLDTVEAISDVFQQGTRIGMDLIATLGRTQLTEMLGSAAPKLQRAGKCSCDIPPPCWMPRNLGNVTSHVCPGGTATIRVRVTNCTPTKREIRLTPAGKAEELNSVTVKPPSLSLDAIESGVFIVSMPVEAAANLRQEFEVLLWVRGCLDHYLRWRVLVDKRGTNCCHEVDVDDCPDYVHHWYDHFYCERPCLR